MGVKKKLKKVVPEKIKFYIRLLLNRIKYRSLIKTTQRHYEEVIENLKNRESRPLRFAAYVVFDSTFGANTLIKLMQRDPSFDSKIVVIPDISRGRTHMISQYKSTKDFFIKNYGKENIIDGYDVENNIFNDLADSFDVIYFANPYDDMVHEFHGVKYNVSKNILPIYIPYAFQPDKYSRRVIAQLNMSLCWKIFADTNYTISEYKRYSLNKGSNVFISGYPKMDGLEKINANILERKRIIIAPHHTITNDILPLSNFLRLKDYFLTLPKRYPQVDFIFRPHPLLFTNMINEGFWTEFDKMKYIETLCTNRIKYSYGGDYFDLFQNSDAIIHDCSSYIVEYLFLDKPCCFILRGRINKIFNKLGKRCLKCYYIARSECDIDKFIETVCSDTVNVFDKKRKKILPHIKVNYPDTSRTIFEILKNSLEV